ncbi:TPA: antitoxin MazE [Staphylococcus pseudintermedius]|nr:antitoxin MazE [Staphylococcus pseudintermedius]
MSAFNQTRFKNLEQSLKEGYVQMADLNLSLATEAYPVECEACDCNESHLKLITRKTK